MSAFTASYWRRVQSQAARYRAPVRSAVTKAIKSLQTRLNDREVEQLLANGQLNTIVLKLFDTATLDTSFAPMDAAVQRVAKAGLDTAVKTLLPNRGKIGDVAVVHFDVLSPNVTRAIKTLDTNVVQRFKTDVSAGALRIIEDGLRAGVNPRQLKRELGDAIGVGAKQADAIANYRGLLESLDPAALGRELRGKRFDGAVTRALESGKLLTADKIDDMVSVYAKNMVAFNAETVSRTATLDALKAGQNLSWEEAIDSGIVDGSRLYKTWVGVLDDRERDEHVAMEGETVPFDEPYSNGEMIPGDSTYNCRCVSYVFEASEKDMADLLG